MVNLTSTAFLKKAARSYKLKNIAWLIAQAAHARENFPENPNMKLSVRASQRQSDSLNNLKDLNKRPFNKKNLKKSSVKKQ